MPEKDGQHWLFRAYAVTLALCVVALLFGLWIGIWRGRWQIFGLLAVAITGVNMFMALRKKRISRQ